MTAQDSSIWHADDDDLRALVDGSANPVLAASLESHLMRCDRCRGQVNELAFTEPIEQVWAAIREAVEAPTPGLVERLLTRCGLSRESGRLLTAVPAMRAGWLLAVFASVLFAGLAAAFAPAVGVGLFLLVAPLAPVAGVAAGFGGTADPSHEVVVTTPYSAGRLLLLRTAAVLVTCTPIAALVGLALPGPAWLAVAWLSPAAAGIALTLVFAPLVGFTASAVSAGVVWSMVALAAAHVREPLALVGPVSQAICLTLVAVCTAVLLVKARNFDLLWRVS